MALGIWGMLSRDQLRTSLDKLEAGRAAGAVISAEALKNCSRS